MGHHRIRRLLGGVLLGVAVVAPALVAGVGGTAGATTETTPTGPMVPGFDQNTLAANDDGSTGQVDLGFSIDFFGSTYDSLYVNNNGNLTFNAPLSSYTPSGLTTYGSPIIAPFWADVDTNPGGNLVTYGTGTVDGHPAFGVNWPGVDCFDTTSGGENWFQVLLIDRSDIAAGDFDIEFNYDQIVWDSGQASGGNGACLDGTSAQVGYTNGSTNALELTGSGVDGAFLDGGPDALVSGSQNSPVAGQYIFPIRSGGGGGEIGGTVVDNQDPAQPVGGALVSACTTGDSAATQCYTGTTDSGGTYLILGVPAATGSLDPLSGYDVTVSPPSSSELDSSTEPQQPGSPPLSVTDGEETTEDFALQGPTPPPDDTTVEGVSETEIDGDEVPVINWEEESPFSTEACSGGTVDITVTGENTQTGATQTDGPYTLTQTGTDPDDDAGIYTGDIPQQYPVHGQATVTEHITCPDEQDVPDVTFTIYIDPSGTVTDAGTGQPIVGATVTLLTSASEDGTFTAVPDGSVIMSPANRTNPDTTTAGGQFGWDTAPGWYEVEASAAGCTTTTTPAFDVPPPVADLSIALPCQGSASPVTVITPLPSATTTAASDVQATSAVVNGTVDPDGAATSVWFDWGTSTSYGQQTAAVSAGSQSATVPESATLTGLQPSTTYDVRIMASNANGTATGGNVTFTTAPAPPTEAAGGGTGTTTTSACAGQTGNAGFVCNVYETVLGRAPDAGGLSGFEALLSGGTSRTQVAYDILTSAEAYGDMVASEYLTALGRAPDAAGLATFVQALQSGLSEEWLEADIAGSPEAYADDGGTPTGFVSALYEELLGRQPDAAGLSSWVAALAAGTTTQQVAYDIATSTEGWTADVAESYAAVLDRAPDPAGLATWVPALASGRLDDQQFDADLLASPEYEALEGF